MPDRIVNINDEAAARHAEMLARAREMRKNMTPEEKKLWFLFLRNHPAKVNRQKIFEPYIADFYCHEAKLVIELDGSQHYFEENLIYDKKRTAFFEKMGIHVIRYTNLDINKHFQAVCDEINRIIRERTT